MTTVINTYKSDKQYDINFTLTDANGAAFDLTGATLVFNAQKQDATTLKFTGSMTIVSAAAGTCKYTVGNTDFDEAGDYYAEIQVTNGSKVVTFGGIVIRVKPELPR
jgi:hypothetical protein